jgi:UDP-GlcNAc:undecaprenyl-phosphate GlcNAc-1-phosphate transferase
LINSINKILEINNIYFTDDKLLVLTSSLIISSLLFYIFQRIYIKKNIYDKINKRSSHSSLATRSGGMAIFTSIFLISIYFYFTGKAIYDFSFIVPLSLLLAVGLYDDIYNIDFKLKFIFQIITAKILIDNGLMIENLHGFLGIYELNRILGQAFTIFIMVAIINSINFIDGIDGLAISVMILFILLFEFFSVSQTPFYILSLIVVASTIPLYYFNFRKNFKVFLGDSGSLFLGGIASIYIVYILSNEYIIKPIYDVHKIIFVLSIFLFPIIDLTRVFFLRLVNGKSPFLPDKNHIHHFILRFFNKHYLVVLLVVSLTLINLCLIQIIF